MKNTLIVNLIGAPGSGKSVLMADLFAKLKKSGKSVDMVTEYFKELVWEDRLSTMQDEFYIFAKQNHRLFRINGKVDIVITDAPLIQKLYYMPTNLDFSETVIKIYNQYENINFFLNRKEWEYEKIGRTQTEEESEKIGLEMKEKLNQNDIPFIEFTKDSKPEEDIELILKIINNKLNKGDTRK